MRLVALKWLVAMLSVGLILSGCSTRANYAEGASSLYIELGTAYLKAGQINEALLNARKAISIDDGASAAHNLLGVVYQRLGKSVLAHEHYTKAVELDRENAYALNALGQFLCLQGHYAQAQRYFKRALASALYPTPWIAAHNAGVCYERVNDTAQAETVYLQAIQRNPQFAPTLLRMAQLSYADGHYLSARDYVQRYAQVAKHTVESLRLGIQTEKQLGNQAFVAKYEQQLKREFPGSVQTKPIE